MRDHLCCRQKHLVYRSFPLQKSKVTFSKRCEDLWKWKRSIRWSFVILSKRLRFIRSMEPARTSHRGLSSIIASLVVYRSPNSTENVRSPLRADKALRWTICPPQHNKKRAENLLQTIKYRQKISSVHHFRYEHSIWVDWQDLNLRSLSPQGSALPTAPHPDAFFLALSHNFIWSVVTCFCITLTTLFVYEK